MESGQVSLRPLSADAAARISPTRMRHFNSAPGDFRRQHSVLTKYDAQLMRSRTAAPDLARSVVPPTRKLLMESIEDCTYCYLYILHTLQADTHICSSTAAFCMHAGRGARKCGSYKCLSVLWTRHMSLPLTGLPQYDDPGTFERHRHDLNAARLSPQTSRAVRRTSSTMANALAG